jgi:propanol-preferring alcohol dehydrogenase
LILVTTGRPSTMRAMVLHQPRTPLRLEELPVPSPAAGQLLLRVHACGVCRTDLHVVDGELPPHRPSVVPGHQIVALVEETGAGVEGFARGDRVGVPWLGWTDGTCRYCTSGRENLCPNARFTGYDLDGGYAEYATADHRFCFNLPAGYPDLPVAPLLCAGLIGYRAWRFAGGAQARTLGLYGFGASAHIVVQLARHHGQRVFAFTRGGDEAAQRFALQMGAEWAGDSLRPGPEPLEAAIIFAPAGELVPPALAAVAPGGRVVCAGIHMSDIPSFPYELLWHEREVRSVANLTRRDGVEFLALATEAGIEPEVETFGLEEANVALERLRAGDVRGAAVLRVEG